LIRRFRRRLTRWLMLAAFAAAGALYLIVNYSSHDPARWHRDPATIERSARPNDFLAAPPGATVAQIDLETTTRSEPPRDLLARFDSVTRAQPRVKVIAGSLDEGMITYVQRSRVIGFPDYITVKAVDAGEGAALIVYSRSRYGNSDLGVNEKRVTAWLAALGDDP